MGMKHLVESIIQPKNTYLPVFEPAMNGGSFAGFKMCIDMILGEDVGGCGAMGKEHVIV